MKIHHLEGYIQSIYLVEYSHGLLLLDGCSRADVPRLREFIESDLGRPFNDLKIVIVTHMHPDHAGAANKLRKLCGAEIVSADKAHQWYRGWNGFLMHLSDIILTFWVAGRLGKPKKNLWYSASLNPDHALLDGSPVPYFPDWQVIETPGHTDRDLSIYHGPTNKLYVADLIVKVKKRFIPPFPVFHPNKYKASVQKVMNMCPQSVLLAHGGEVELQDEDYQHLFERAPTMPKTHWRAAKKKMRRMLARSR